MMPTFSKRDVCFGLPGLTMKELRKEKERQRHMSVQFRMQPLRWEDHVECRPLQEKRSQRVLEVQHITAQLREHAIEK